MNTSSSHTNTFLKDSRIKINQSSVEHSPDSDKFKNYCEKLFDFQKNYQKEKEAKDKQNNNNQDKETKENLKESKDKELMQYLKYIKLATNKTKYQLKILDMHLIQEVLIPIMHLKSKSNLEITKECCKIFLNVAQNKNNHYKICPEDLIFKELFMLISEYLNTELISFILKIFLYLTENKEYLSKLSMNLTFIKKNSNQEAAINNNNNLTVQLSHHLLNSGVVEVNIATIIRILIEKYLDDLNSTNKIYLLKIIYNLFSYNYNLTHRDSLEPIIRCLGDKDENTIVSALKIIYLFSHKNEYSFDIIKSNFIFRIFRIYKYENFEINKILVKIILNLFTKEDYIDLFFKNKIILILEEVFISFEPDQNEEILTTVFEIFKKCIERLDKDLLHKLFSKALNFAQNSKNENFVQSCLSTVDSVLKKNSSFILNTQNNKINIFETMHSFFKFKNFMIVQYSLSIFEIVLRKKFKEFRLNYITSNEKSLSIKTLIHHIINIINEFSQQEIIIKACKILKMLSKISLLHSYFLSEPQITIIRLFNEDIINKKNKVLREINNRKNLKKNKTLSPQRTNLNNENDTEFAYENKIYDMYSQTGKEDNSTPKNKSSNLNFLNMKTNYVNSANNSFMFKNNNLKIPINKVNLEKTISEKKLEEDTQSYQGICHFKEENHLMLSKSASPFIPISPKINCNSKNFNLLNIDENNKFFNKYKQTLTPFASTNIIKKNDDEENILDKNKFNLQREGSCGEIYNSFITNHKNNPIQEGKNYVINNVNAEGDDSFLINHGNNLTKKKGKIDDGDAQSNIINVDNHKNYGQNHIKMSYNNNFNLSGNNTEFYFKENNHTQVGKQILNLQNNFIDKLNSGDFNRVNSNIYLKNNLIEKGMNSNSSFAKKTHNKFSSVRRMTRRRHTKKEIDQNNQIVKKVLELELINEKLKISIEILGNLTKYYENLDTLTNKGFLEIINKLLIEENKDALSSIVKCIRGFCRSAKSIEIILSCSMLVKILQILKVCNRKSKIEMFNHFRSILESDIKIQKQFILDLGISTLINEISDSDDQLNHIILRAVYVISSNVNKLFIVYYNSQKEWDQVDNLSEESNPSIYKASDEDGNNFEVCKKKNLLPYQLKVQYVDSDLNSNKINNINPIKNQNNLVTSFPTPQKFYRGTNIPHNNLNIFNRKSSNFEPPVAVTYLNNSNTHLYPAHKDNEYSSEWKNKNIKVGSQLDSIYNNQNYTNEINNDDIVINNNENKISEEHNNHLNASFHINFLKMVDDKEKNFKTIEGSQPFNKNFNMNSIYFNNLPINHNYNTTYIIDDGGEKNQEENTWKQFNENIIDNKCKMNISIVNDQIMETIKESFRPVKSESRLNVKQFNIKNNLILEKNQKENISITNIQTLNNNLTNPENPSLVNKRSIKTFKSITGSSSKEMNQNANSLFINNMVEGPVKESNFNFRSNTNYYNKINYQMHIFKSQLSRKNMMNKLLNIGVLNITSLETHKELIKILINLYLNRYYLKYFTKDSVFSQIMKIVEIIMKKSSNKFEESEMFKLILIFLKFICEEENLIRKFLDTTVVSDIIHIINKNEYKSTIQNNSELEEFHYNLSLVLLRLSEFKSQSDKLVFLKETFTVLETLFDLNLFNGKIYIVNVIKNIVAEKKDFFSEEDIIRFINKVIASQTNLLIYDFIELLGILIFNRSLCKKMKNVFNFLINEIKSVSYSSKFKNKILEIILCLSYEKDNIQGYQLHEFLHLFKNLEIPINKKITLLILMNFSTIPINFKYLTTFPQQENPLEKNFSVNNDNKHEDENISTERLIEKVEGDIINKNDVFTIINDLLDSDKFSQILIQRFLINITSIENIDLSIISQKVIDVLIEIVISNKKMQDGIIIFALAILVNLSNRNVIKIKNTCLSENFYQQSLILDSNLKKSDNSLKKKNSIKKKSTLSIINFSYKKANSGFKEFSFEQHKLSSNDKKLNTRTNSINNLNSRKNSIINFNSNKLLEDDEYEGKYKFFKKKFQEIKEMDNEINESLVKFNPILNKNNPDKNYSLNNISIPINDIENKCSDKENDKNKDERPDSNAQGNGDQTFNFLKENNSELGKNKKNKNDHFDLYIIDFLLLRISNIIDTMNDLFQRKNMDIISLAIMLACNLSRKLLTSSNDLDDRISQCIEDFVLKEENSKINIIEMDSGKFFLIAIIKYCVCLSCYEKKVLNSIKLFEFIMNKFLNEEQFKNIKLSKGDFLNNSINFNLMESYLKFLNIIIDSKELSIVIFNRYFGSNIINFYNEFLKGFLEILYDPNMEQYFQPDSNLQDLIISILQILTTFIKINMIDVNKLDLNIQKIIIKLFHYDPRKYNDDLKSLFIYVLGTIIDNSNKSNSKFKNKLDSKVELPFTTKDKISNQNTKKLILYDDNNINKFQDTEKIDFDQNEILKKWLIDLFKIENNSFFVDFYCLKAFLKSLKEESFPELLWKSNKVLKKFSKYLKCNDNSNNFLFSKFYGSSDSDENDLNNILIKEVIKKIINYISFDSRSHIKLIESGLFIDLKDILFKKFNPHDHKLINKDDVIFFVNLFLNRENLNFLWEDMINILKIIFICNEVIISLKIKLLDIFFYWNLYNSETKSFSEDYLVVFDLIYNNLLNNFSDKIFLIEYFATKYDFNSGLIFQNSKMIEVVYKDFLQFDFKFPSKSDEFFSFLNILELIIDDFDLNKSNLNFNNMKEWNAVVLNSENLGISMLISEELICDFLDKINSNIESDCFTDLTFLDLILNILFNYLKKLKTFEKHHHLTKTMNDDEKMLFFISKLDLNSFIKIAMEKSLYIVEIRKIKYLENKQIEKEKFIKINYDEEKFEKYNNNDIIKELVSSNKLGINLLKNEHRNHQSNDLNMNESQLFQENNEFNRYIDKNQEILNESLSKNENQSPRNKIKNEEYDDIKCNLSIREIKTCKKDMEKIISKENNISKKSIENNRTSPKENTKKNKLKRISITKIDDILDAKSRQEKENLKKLILDPSKAENFQELKNVSMNNLNESSINKIENNELKDGRNSIENNSDLDFIKKLRKIKIDQDTYFPKKLVEELDPFSYFKGKSFIFLIMRFFIEEENKNIIKALLEKNNFLGTKEFFIKITNILIEKEEYEKIYADVKVRIPSQNFIIMNSSNQDEINEKEIQNLEDEIFLFLKSFSLNDFMFILIFYVNLFSIERINFSEFLCDYFIKLFNLIFNKLIISFNLHNKNQKILSSLRLRNNISNNNTSKIKNFKSEFSNKSGEDGDSYLFSNQEKFFDKKDLKENLEVINNNINDQEEGSNEELDMKRENEKFDIGASIAEKRIEDQLTKSERHIKKNSNFENNIFEKENKSNEKEFTSFNKLSKEPKIPNLNIERISISRSNLSAIVNKKNQDSGQNDEVNNLIISANTVKFLDQKDYKSDNNIIKSSEKEGEYRYINKNFYNINIINDIRSRPHSIQDVINQDNMENHTIVEEDKIKEKNLLNISNHLLRRSKSKRNNSNQIFEKSSQDKLNMSNETIKNYNQRNIKISIRKDISSNNNEKDYFDDSKINIHSNKDNGKTLVNINILKKNDVYDSISNKKFSNENVTKLVEIKKNNEIEMIQKNNNQKTKMKNNESINIGENHALNKNFNLNISKLNNPTNKIQISNYSSSSKSKTLENNTVVNFKSSGKINKNYQKVVTNSSFPDEINILKNFIGLKSKINDSNILNNYNTDDIAKMYNSSVKTTVSAYFYFCDFLYENINHQKIIFEAIKSIINIITNLKINNELKEILIRFYQQFLSKFKIEKEQDLNILITFFIKIHFDPVICFIKNMILECILVNIDIKLFEKNLDSILEIIEMILPLQEYNKKDVLEFFSFVKQVYLMITTNRNDHTLLEKIRKFTLRSMEKYQSMFDADLKHKFTNLLSKIELMQSKNENEENEANRFFFNYSHKNNKKSKFLKLEI